MGFESFKKIYRIDFQTTKKKNGLLFAIFVPLNKWPCLHFSSKQGHGIYTLKYTKLFPVLLNQNNKSLLRKSQHIGDGLTRSSLRSTTLSTAGGKESREKFLPSLRLVAERVAERSDDRVSRL